jgi:glycogen debranching enzyme
MLRRIELSGQTDTQSREWLTTNGLGGYASGMLWGPPIRRWHGWLVAAMPAPLGRVNLLSHMDEALIHDDGTSAPLTATAFRLEWGLPVWELEAGPVRVERRLVMPHGKNQTLIQWRQTAGPAATLVVTPWLHPRRAETPVDDVLPDIRLHVGDTSLSAEADAMPDLRMAWTSGAFTTDSRTAPFHYPNEAEGEDPADGVLWTPGTLSLTLDQERAVSLSTHQGRFDFTSEWNAEIQRRERLVARADPALQDGVAAEMAVLADSFVIRPQDRPTVADARTIVAGYHWFADWGRDTMISLEGLALVTGRHEDARRILLMFAAFAKDGLIPNMFPDGAGEGVYHTADATLWFFHAVDRYWRHSDDDETVRGLLPLMDEIMDHHLRGTRFGIGMDPADGLMVQGQEGWQLTWMDAKADDWVVTPRRGKAVEINALWYNALGALADWRCHFGQEYRHLEELAEKVRRSFNALFWVPELGYLVDVVGQDGPDPALRPNQLFAISLPRPVLDSAHWPAVMTRIRDHLATPFGIRSLSADSPSYRPIYFGNRVQRDGAYHQGTVWTWLAGPFVEAWLKTFPKAPETAAKLLESISGNLDGYGVGCLAEVFDADPPHAARGCISQAWSVAEWTRV